MLVVKLIALVIAFLVTLFGVTSAASAYPQCFFDVFEPQALTREVSAAVATAGIATANLNREKDAFSTRMMLLRDGMIVGEMYSSVDARFGRAEMTVLSAAGDVLMRFEETRKPCIGPHAAGLCASIEGFTEFESPLDTWPAYSVWVGADESFPTYLRYDKYVSRWEFRRSLINSIDWLVATLDATDVYREPITTSAEEQLFWALASNPTVAPYVHRLTISSKRDRLVITGVVPSNFVYDQVVQAAFDAGLWTVVPELVIDTGTAIVELGPTLGRCP
jgi:hypothetical protein